eukprot:CAMPEP_0172484986 /NCGR_PEP_ID=MMETSP1066-20121228/12702_1 /TAXON_ID=671091 /ORGANISM="Coscinodiscus wailesii, Strain CCMP2513" /LENGTH=850 /DNA_ID=CAMNT_0013249861 /DNA_START=106 /DNA_END=2658 /DNA_ORIENTATION=+
MNVHGISIEDRVKQETNLNQRKNESARTTITQSSSHSFTCPDDYDNTVPSLGPTECGKSEKLYVDDAASSKSWRTTSQGDNSLCSWMTPHEGGETDIEIFDIDLLEELVPNPPPPPPQIDAPPQHAEFKLPDDVYSFLFFCSKDDAPSVYFTVLFVFAIQVLSLTCLLISLFSDTNGGYGDFGMKMIPPDVSFIVRLSQCLAVMMAVLLEQNVFKFNLFHVIWKPADTPCLQRLLSYVLRFIASILGVVISFLIIVTSDGVTDLFMNFTAVMFINTLDNAMYFLANAGFFSSKFLRLAQIVDSKSFSVRDKNCIRNWFMVTVVTLAMYSSLVLIWLRQETGYYMPKSYTFEYDDPKSLMISFHNGIYEWDAMERCGDRPIYYEKNAKENESYKWIGVIGYCDDVQRWTWSRCDKEEPGTCHPCVNYSIMSPKTTGFVIDSDSSSWLTDDGVQTYLGKLTSNECHKDFDCHNDATCNISTKKCQCGRNLSPMCEIDPPCKHIALNDMNTFDWGYSSNHSLLEDNTYATEPTPVLVYGRPVYYTKYENPVSYDFVMYIGSRWFATRASTDPQHIDRGKHESKGMLYDLNTRLQNTSDTQLHHRVLIDYFNSFHADNPIDGWSADFLSDVTMGYDPLTIKWNKWMAFDDASKEIISTEEVNYNFLCAECNEFYSCGSGDCVNGTCECNENHAGVNCEALAIEGTLSVTIASNESDGRCQTCQRSMNWIKDYPQEIFFEGVPKNASSEKCNRIYGGRDNKNVFISRDFSTSSSCSSAEEAKSLPFLVIDHGTNDTKTRVEKTILIHGNTTEVFEGKKDVLCDNIIDITSENPECHDLVNENFEMASLHLEFYII